MGVESGDENAQRPGETSVGRGLEVIRTGALAAGMMKGGHDEGLPIMSSAVKGNCGLVRILSCSPKLRVLSVDMTWSIFKQKAGNSFSPTAQLA